MIRSTVSKKSPQTNSGSKATAIAPANIAFIKYWGKKDENLRLPANGSLAVNLSNLLTTTTVEFSRSLKNDEIVINGKKDPDKVARVKKQLDVIRKIAKISACAKVISKNNFSTAGGLASSASGFAALTLAGTRAAGLILPEKELSVISRLGSGSACRSIPDGFTEWYAGNSHESSYAVSIFSPDYWDIVIIVALAESEEKAILTSDGMRLANSSPFYSPRLNKIAEKIKLLKKYLSERNFDKFGEICEAETLEMHSIALTSSPPIIYWKPRTVQIMNLVQQIRKKEFPVFFTIDAGPHVCIICQGKNAIKLVKTLRENKINKYIINRPAKGAVLTDKHLF